MATVWFWLIFWLATIPTARPPIHAYPHSTVRPNSALYSSNSLRSTMRAMTSRISYTLLDPGSGIQQSIHILGSKPWSILDRVELSAPEGLCGGSATLAFAHLRYQ